MALVIQTPGADPLTAAQVEGNLRLASGDSEVPRLIKAARDWAEEQLDLTLTTTTYDLFLDEFPKAKTAEGFTRLIRFPRPPLQTVTSVKYIDTNGNQQPWADFVFDSKTMPGRLTPAWGKTWPSIRKVLNAVEIRFDAGFGTPAQVPEGIKHLLHMLVGHWYENREAVLVGEVSKEIEISVTSLRNTFRNITL